MIDFAKELNPEQYAAATSGDGPMLVLAAAGTGKTRTLVHRVAYLVERGVPSERILLLTFTNRAAREMIERATALVPALGQIASGTFHSVCARLLREFGESIGWPSSFTIIDEEDQKKLMAEAIKQHVENPKDFPKHEVMLSVLSDCANRQVRYEQHLRTLQSKIAVDPELAITVLNDYVRRKRELNAMDFDDLIVNGLRLLTDVPEVRDILQERYLHVLVDEYQDTNTIQAQFTDILAAKHRNIMVVGDDFQCIYTWRGAKYENIMDFPERWPDCKTVKLERNYRSYAPILDLANHVMKDVRHKFDKTLRPFRQAAGGEAPRPRLFRVNGGMAQAETIMQLISKLPSLGIRLKDIAILYRSHYTSIDIQFALTRNRIPFRITSGVGVFEQIHVKDTLSFLRLCVDPAAKLSFTRLFSLLPGVGDAAVNKLWSKLGGEFDFRNPFAVNLIDDNIPKRAKSSWEKLRAAFAEVAATEKEEGDFSGSVVLAFCDRFYAEHLKTRFEESDAESRLEDVTELQAQINNSPQSLEEFLGEVALMTNLDAEAKRNLPADHLTLSTVHQAKGLEWPVVFLPWVSETIFPSQRACDEGNADEERRLFYVAVTRARNRLYLCAPYTKRTSDGFDMPVGLSPFIANTPPEMLEVQNLGHQPAAFNDWRGTPSRGGWNSGARRPSSGSWPRKGGGGTKNGGMKTYWYK